MLLLVLAAFRMIDHKDKYREGMKMNNVNALLSDFFIFKADETAMSANIRARSRVEVMKADAGVYEEVFFSSFSWL